MTSPTPKRRPLRLAPRGYRARRDGRAAPRRRPARRYLHCRRRLCRLVDGAGIKTRDPSLDVAIVEADICGGGASGRNSGMVLSQWAKFAALKAFCGEAGAIALGPAPLAHRRTTSKPSAKRTELTPSSAATAGFGAPPAPNMSDPGMAFSTRWQSSGAASLSRSDRIRRSQSCAAPIVSCRIHDPTAATLHPGKLVRGLRRVAVEQGRSDFREFAR